jgi:hypothetical protein
MALPSHSHDQSPAPTILRKQTLEVLQDCHHISRPRWMHSLPAHFNAHTNAIEHNPTSPPCAPQALPHENTMNLEKVIKKTTASFTHLKKERGITLASLGTLFTRRCNRFHNLHRLQKICSGAC